MHRKYTKTVGSRSYKNYVEKTLKKAIADVQAKKISLCQAAKKCTVPKSTISKLIKENRTEFIHGGQTSLTPEMESELVGVLKVAGDWAYPLELLGDRFLVQEYLNANNIRIGKCKEIENKENVEVPKKRQLARPKPPPKRTKTL